MRISLPAVALLFFSGLSLTSCMREEGPTGIRIAVVPLTTETAYWQAVHAGALKAEKELKNTGVDVDVLWKGPLRADDSAYQAQIFRSFLLNKVNGVVLAVSDAEGLATTIDEAREGNVPVVAIGAPFDLRPGVVGFVGTDFENAGRLAAQHLAKLVGGEGSVLVVGETASAKNQARARWAREAISAIEGMTVIAEEENIEAQIVAGSVDAVLCLTATDTEEVIAMLRRSEKVGEVGVIGWGHSERSLTYLGGGDLHALLLENPMEIGYLGVLSAAGAIRGNPLEPNVDTGAVLVTRDTLRSSKVQELLNPPIEEWLGMAR